MSKKETIRQIRDLCNVALNEVKILPVRDESNLMDLNLVDRNPKSGFFELTDDGLRVCTELVACFERVT
jgi:hypothetical protein